jgi:DNA-directed RNA polymerase beta subunit/intein/homing endonuclease
MPNPGFNEPALPPGLRAFDDAPTVRKAIYDGVLESLGKRFPVADGKHRLELANLRYASPQDFPLSAQKKAIMANRNLATQLVGKWRLVDEVTGGVLDEKEDTVMHVPYYTDRGTVINRGSEYSITSQARLKPGVYTRTKKSGEHEAHFNILPGSGKTFRLWMEPATGIFRVNVGQANIPAYQFFSTMGIPDAEMQKAWGQELFQANRAKVDRQATAKLYERFAGNQANPAANEQEMAEYLRTTVPKYAVNEEVVARTMGLPKTTTVTPQLLLRTTQKLLNISRGEEEEDNREAPQFSDYYSPDDFIKERIDKDAGHVTRNLLFRIRRDGNLKRLGHAPLNSYIQSLILGSGLASTLEETNPLQTLDQQHRIIKLGEGGISSAETVIDEARDVHAGQAGFIDPVSGPESEKCGIDMRAAYRTFKGPDKQIYGEFSDPNGKPIYMTPMEAADKTLAFPGQSQATPEVYAIKNGKIDRVPTDEVDAWIPSSSHMYSPTVNVTPMGTGFMPSRAFFSSKYQTQFLPVVGGEAPLVQAAVPDGSGRSFSEYYGRKVGCLNSQVAGIVTKVTDDGVSITDKDGKKHFVELTKDMPFNRMSLCGSMEVFLRRAGTVVKTRLDAYEQQNADEILSYDPATKQSAWKRIKAFIRHTNTKRLFRVMFRSGRHVDVTADHSLLTLNDVFELVPVLPLDCVLETTRCPVVFGVTDQVAITEWTYTDGVLDGLYLSEGYTGKQKGLVSIAVAPPGRRDHVRQLVQSFGLTPFRGKVNCTWTDHARWSRWRTDFGKYASGKFIAPHVFSRGMIYLKGLVAGYMGGDGCLWADGNESIQLEASSTSQRLRDDLASVFQLLGIFAQIYPPKYNGVGWKDLYKLRIRSTDISKLDCWFCYEDRQQKLRDLLNDHYRNTEADCLPVLRSARKFLYTTFPGRSAGRRVHRSVSEHGKVAKQWLQGCSGVVGQWATSDILWDTVVELIPLDHEPYVYDFSVEDSEAFATVHGLLVHNTACSYRAAVKEGDLVKPGELLATSNFTDDQGNLAMGRNLKTAVLPSRGWSFEDAMVISESAAKKLTTERLYAIDKEARHGVQISRNRFISAFPAKYTKEQIANMDENGVAQVGTVVNKGDPIVLAVGPKALSTADAELGRLHKALRNAFRDEALEWEYSTPGIVTDVGRTTTGVKVNVKAQSPVQVGDKLTTAGASKGVTGLIVSDDEMPKDNETGEPYEMLLNPMVVLSRVAPNQLVELQLAKVAKKTGKPYILPDTPPEEGWVEFAKRELEKNGLQPTKDIYDPATGRLVPSVGDGYMYISAFHHLAEKKLCVSEDTEVLTWRGWVLAPDVRADDLLATLNPFTGETEYRPITHRAEYQIRHPERLIRVTGNDRDELVTADHRVYIDGELVLAEALLELVPCP